VYVLVGNVNKVLSSEGPKSRQDLCLLQLDSIHVSRACYPVAVDKGLQLMTVG
jgi:hypothetical protein